MLGVALRAGQVMVESGANAARVEEAIIRFGNALGAERMDVFATPSGIVVSAICGEQHRTRVVRVVKTGIDLNRVAAISRLAERASSGDLSRARIRAELERIATQPRLYGHLTTTVSVGAACAAFALLFGGYPLEALLAGGAAVVGQAVRELLVRWHFGRLTMTFLVTVLAASLALLGSRLLSVPAPGLAMASAVLLLVPGVLMVSSIVDLFRGNILSGIVRATSAVLIIGTIAGGLFVVLLLSAPHLALTTRTPPPLWAATLLGFVAALGFAVLFDVPRRTLWGSGLTGAMGLAMRNGLLLLFPGVPHEAAMLFAGFVIALVSRVIAHVMRTPTGIFTIPGFIPLVPGVLAFRAVLGFAEQDYSAGTSNLVQVTLRLAALAAGLGTAQALTRHGWWPFAR
ncbi:threonine/serine exporter family protein [Archangium violaceum]|uniref:threonine/serine ThrE exporter family protein n=1 Tax=Archangium violaceum TaxID=83451 RepID=UPI00195041A7|nr:threonine/serine exporter family protein [Archangium violaceum]QRO01221.1 threonine/serine exporter family protein [Archangium violaceum]